MRRERIGDGAQEVFPELRLDDWQDTYNTLHLWTQVVGKVRLALTPPMNHYWQVPLYLTARGLTTSPIPYGNNSFEIELDFLDHNLWVRTGAGDRKGMSLIDRSVAEFHRELFRMMDAIGINVHIWTTPSEIPNPIPFEMDNEHASYDEEAVERFFHALSRIDLALKEFAGRFQGKQSPIHFFWGSFDLALTRFSGRPAPERRDADRMTREAYSHQVISFGFWPGTPGVCDANFYAYAAPEPPGFSQAALTPRGATYSEKLREFLLSYELVRDSPSPRQTLLEFFQSAYEAGASLGNWDRQSLDRWTPSNETAHLSEHAP
jgi:hypothetical protein